MRRYTEQINGKWVITTERDNTIAASGDGNKLKSVSGASIDHFAELEDKIESGEIDYVSDRGKEIARLTAENQRLREDAAEQKSIAEYEHAMQMEWFRIACDYKSENAELRETLSKMETVEKELTDRLKNAVELPCVKSVKTKEWIDKVEVGDTIWEWAVVYIDGQGEFVVEPCVSLYAAEAWMKELRGGEK